MVTHVVFRRCQVNHKPQAMDRKENWIFFNVYATLLLKAGRMISKYLSKPFGYPPSNLHLQPAFAVVVLVWKCVAFSGLSYKTLKFLNNKSLHSRRSFTCRSVSRLLVSLTRDLVASNSILSFSWVSLRQLICAWAEPRFCSPSRTSSWRWDTCGWQHGVNVSPPSPVGRTVSALFSAPPGWPCWAWPRAPLSSCRAAAGGGPVAPPRTGAWSQIPDSFSGEKKKEKKKRKETYLHLHTE